MFRCLVPCGTEPTPGARAREAARLISQCVGDLAVVALASDDRRAFEAFAVDSRDPAMTGMMRRAVESADRERATLELRSELGVDLVQGFHVGRPRPLEER